VLPRI
jgi:hypothetical protein